MGGNPKAKHLPHVVCGGAGEEGVDNFPSTLLGSWLRHPVTKRQINRRKYTEV